MNQLATSQLINLLGFTVGIALYALLLAMTLQQQSRDDATKQTRINWLLLTTAMLGLFWNAGEFAVFVLRDFGVNAPFALLSSIAYAALGFLPAVVVHSAWTEIDEKPLAARLFTWSAYLASAAASFLHLQTAITDDFAPSAIGLQILTFAYLLILAALFVFAFQQNLQRKAVWATSLAVFAVSALHLSLPHETADFWLIELVGHHASLLLAVTVLLQDFRFAFADLFLKRALSLFLLTLVAFSLYVFIAQPLIAFHNAHSQTDSQPTVILLGAWIGTALAYPKLHDFAVWFVDKILLRRADYKELRDAIGQRISQTQLPETVLADVCQSLKAALTANEASWREVSTHNNEKHFAAINAANNKVDICVATAEAPFYHVTLAHFAGGRKLLSDEIELLENVALIAGRRIDALRVSHERCEQEIREQEIGKLASEAELRALRAQINPHFLFNALTTIGYLIQTSPDKALATLLKLTQLLRGVLLRASNEFSTLDDELKLIESYLEIERARFEERLEIEIDVAPELLKMRVPSLILQPLVENAVKHGITPKKDGGTVRIAASIKNQNLVLEVADSGVGAVLESLTEQRQRGVGLNNIEARLQSHFGKNAALMIESGKGKGTIAKIMLPLVGAQTARSARLS